MQASLDASSLKPFTRAINCLARYGDELTICAYPDYFSLSATNSAKSAFCRFKYEKEFFSRYSVGQPRLLGEVEGTNGAEENQLVKGQLLAKNLLSVLKHRTVEKSVERCELSIVEGGDQDQEEESDEEFDSLESKLVIRFLCKHGIVKTHRLVLSIPTALMAPGVPDTPDQARVNIGPAPLHTMLDHFPINRGAKADPQLIWSFSDSEVNLKTCESSMDKGKGQISTELTISAEEFDAYDIYTSPIIIAFHLREFNATIAYAEAMNLPLEMRFTNTIAPLFIDVEGDCFQGLFVIATSQPPGVPIPTSQNSYRPMTQTSHKKREREDTPADVHRQRRVMRIVQKVEIDPTARQALQSRQPSRVPGSMPPPSLPGPSSLRPPPQSAKHPSHPRIPPGSKVKEEPLFLPSSQLSVAENRILQEAGMGDIGTLEELSALLEDEGEEVEFPPSQAAGPEHGSANSLQIEKPSQSLDFMDEMDFGPTQAAQRQFQPLFTD